MKQQTAIGGAESQKLAAPPILLHPPKKTARILNVSESWLAKARMRGDGPAFVKIGRSVRYEDTTLRQWMRSMQRVSTSQV
jgi:hypothetical protein